MNLRKTLYTQEIRALSHHNTIVGQILKLVPRHEFETLAKHHHVGRKLRRTSRWSQFVSLCIGQLSGRKSLRDITDNVQSQQNKLYHLGAKPVARSSFARLNEQQPHTLFEALFSKLYKRCQQQAPRHGFRFKNSLISLDTTLVDLSLKLFPWSDYNRDRGAMKVHIGLDHAGLIPAFATITDGKKSDISFARTLDLPKGSIVVCDKGYVDYEWYKRLENKDVFIVTRLKKNQCYRVTQRRPVKQNGAVTSDQTIEFTAKKPQQLELKAMRRIGYRDPQTGKYFQFLTNHFELSADTIAAIYKDRWQIELFFKTIKQNLKIKHFLGTSRNAIKTQIWVALCCYLLIQFVRFSSQSTLSFQSLLRLIQVNIFERRALRDLVLVPPPDPLPAIDRRQLCLL